MNLPLLYSSRPQIEQNFIRNVCGYILSEPLENKPKSNDFAACFVEGRNREINTLEDWAAIYSFKRFSKFDYPVFVFCNNNTNWMNGDYATLSNVHFIQIPELNSLEEYTNFCIKELYFRLPPEIENIITLQADAMLLKNGFEDYCINSKCDWLSSHWRHLASIDVFDIDKWKSFRWRTPIGNGGFSYRRASKMREIYKEFGHLVTRESGRDDNRAPMEDLWYCYLGFLNRIMRMPTLKQCDGFAIDPLDSKIFNEFKEGKRNFYGFHYMTYKSEWPDCTHD